MIPFVSEYRASLYAYGLSVLMFLGAPSTTRAATYTVGAGDVSALIAAIQSANGTAEADVINLAVGAYELSAVDNLSSGPNGLPSISSRITINGASLDSAGRISTAIRRPASAPKFRIFHITATGELTLDRVRIVRGDLVDAEGDFSPGCPAGEFGDSCGGGLLIETGGAAFLSNSRLDDNSTGVTGGGAYNNGRLMLYNTTVSGGRAFTVGGGISNASSATLTVVRSTITDNLGDESAGGIYNAGTLVMRNSTVSGNQTSGGRPTGAGIANRHKADLGFVTITQNDGGGIENDGAGVVALVNSILAVNFSYGEPLDCIGNLRSLGYNIIGTNINCIIDVARGRDQVGRPGAEIDPLLRALAYNSAGNGAAQTHALRDKSPAVNAATPRGPLGGFDLLFPPTDQRGFLRADGLDDVGAHERNARPGCIRLIELPTTVGPPFTLPIGPIPATIVGNASDNVLTGTPGRDVIHGLGGNDTIRGLGGDDLVCGGPGDDRIEGNQGADEIYGEDGSDELRGSTEDDRLYGGAGSDECFGGNHISGDSAAECEIEVGFP